MDNLAQAAVIPRRLNIRGLGKYQRPAWKKGFAKRVVMRILAGVKQ